MNKECESCIKRKTMWCPTSIDCMALDELPHHLDKISALKKIDDLQQENKQLKEEIARLREKIENLTTMTVCGDRKQIKNTAQYKLELAEQKIDKIIEENKELNKRLENEQKVVEEYLKLEDDYELLYNDLDNANSKLSDLMKSHLEAIEYIKENIKGNYFRRYEDEIYRYCDELLEILGDRDEYNK